MARLNLKDHFTWAIIAGVVLAANGVIQLAGGNRGLGVASIAVGVIAVVLGVIRPRPLSATTLRSVAGWARPVGLVLVAGSLLLALFAGLPEHFRNGRDLPLALAVALWAMLVVGLAVLALDWRRKAAGRGPAALIAGVIVGVLAIVAAATPLTRLAVIAAWQSANPADLRLVVAVDAAAGIAASDDLLARAERSLTRYLQAQGQFHPPERTADGVALLLAAPDPYDLEALREAIFSGYLGFHLVHPDGDGGAPPAGTRALFSDDGPLLVETVPVLTSASVAGARVSSGADDRPVLDVAFDDDGARRLAEITAANVSRRLAVVFRDRVLTAPEITGAIGDGRARISGLTSDEAFALARALYLGGLPAPLVLVSEDALAAGAD